MFTYLRGGGRPPWGEALDQPRVRVRAIPVSFSSFSVCQDWVEAEAAGVRDRAVHSMRLECTSEH